MKFYAVSRNDGAVSITTLVSGTIEEAIAKWPSSQRDAVMSTREIEFADIPTDRTFRNAWTSDLTVDMPKAREIHRDHLRQMRAPLLATLDAEYLIADERGDLTAKIEIATKKQALRDVTADPTIEAARTPEELKAVLSVALTV